MNAAEFYALACRDRERAVRHLLIYDAHGLRTLAEACATHLVERFGVPIPSHQVLAIWQQVGLISTSHAQAALASRAVGE